MNAQRTTGKAAGTGLSFAPRKPVGGSPIAQPIRALISAALLSATPALAEQPVSGQLGEGKPNDIRLEMSRNDDGTIALSQTEFRLAHGGYYRLNVICPQAVTPETGLHFESPQLMENAHIRVLSVLESEMEFYAQGLSFRAIQCDGKGGARFSFHPMRKGEYPFLVKDHSDPPQEARGRFIVD
ncbi:hypothetical protein ACSQ76_09030 [Roseovarius sp. B08]|uniref:hypothetical protein n=1 Tax=Roseovarius sp. B08 TaxID=3449223 RepID=UPI003EDC0E50